MSAVSKDVSWLMTKDHDRQAPKCAQSVSIKCVGALSEKPERYFRCIRKQESSASGIALHEASRALLNCGAPTSHCEHHEQLDKYQEYKTSLWSLPLLPITFLNPSCS